ncbi:MAG: diaminopimelate epimerase [Actinobacteria bacterium]|nr:diaminopimelate epimerase [Actinomycetota bacterium]
MSVPAERWEGAGNIYLLIDAADLSRPLDPDQARNVCALLGGDGVLEVRRDDGADISMRIWNPDGSQSEACGNGTRMVARWLAEQTDQEHVSINTAAGILECDVDGEIVAARMPQTRLDGPQYAPNGDGFPYAHTFVSVGNPHVVIPVDDINAFPLAEVGPELEHHAWFPERTNVEIVERIDEHHLRMRVWERGVGETRACGTGACAVAVAAVVAGTATSPVTVQLPGGELMIEVGDDGFVAMHGPARRIERLLIPASYLV